MKDLFRYTTLDTERGIRHTITVPKSIIEQLEDPPHRKQPQTVYPLQLVTLDSTGFDYLRSHLEALCDIPAERPEGERAIQGIAHAARWTLRRIEQTERAHQWPEYRRPPPETRTRRARAAISRPTTRKPTPPRPTRPSADRAHRGKPEANRHNR